MGCAGFLRQVPARYAEYEIGRRRQVRRGGRPPLFSVRSPLRLPSVLSLRVASRPDRKPKIAMRFQHPADALLHVPIEIVEMPQDGGHRVEAARVDRIMPQPAQLERAARMRRARRSGIADLPLHAPRPRR